MSKQVAAISVLVCALACGLVLFFDSPSDSLSPSSRNAETATSSLDARRISTADPSLVKPDDSERLVADEGQPKSRTSQYRVTATVVDDVVGLPIKDVILTLVQEGTTLASTTSDAAGSAEVFLFQRPGRGRVHVEFNHVDFAPFVVEPSREVLAGTEILLGVVKLERGTRVSGVAVDGETRAPIAGARFFWIRRPIIGGVPTFRPLGVGDGEGRFVGYERLPSAANNQTITIVADSSVGIGWSSVNVVRDREELSNLEIPIFDSASLDIEVIDEAGSPVADAAVWAIPQFSPFADGTYPYFARFTGTRTELFSRLETRSGASGAAQLSLLPRAPTPEANRRNGYLPSNSYVVAAELPGHGMAIDWSVRLQPGPNRVSLQLVHAGPEWVTGRVVTVQGGPIQDARVNVVGKLAVTDENGSFSIPVPNESMDRDRWWLTAKAVGYVSLTLSGKALLADPLLIKLAPATTLCGRVIDDSGHPVSHAEVHGRLRNQSTGQSTTTNEDGSFALQGVSAGVLDLTVAPPEPSLDWVAAERLLHLIGDEVPTIVLHRARGRRARLEASIVDHRTGASLDCARASIVRGDFRTARGVIPVERKAGLVLAKDLLPGKYILRLEITGLEFKHEFVIPEGADVVHERVVVGSGAVNCQVVINDVPPDLLTRRIFIVTEPTDQGRWVNHPDAARVTPGCVLLQPDGDLRFRMERFTVSDSVRFRVVNHGLYGRAESAIPVGGEVDVILQVTAGGALDFQLAADARHANDWIEVEISIDGSTWSPPTLLAVGSESTQMVINVPVSEKINWRATRFHDRGTVLPPRETHVGGVVTLGAGQTVRVELTF